MHRIDNPKMLIRLFKSRLFQLLLTNKNQDLSEIDFVDIYVLVKGFTKTFNLSLLLKVIDPVSFDYFFILHC